MKVVCNGNSCAFEPGDVQGDAISTAEFRRTVLASERPVVVEFYRSTGCSRCSRAAPKVEELRQKFRGRVDLLTIDVDQNPSLARQHGVGPLPHFVLYNQGGRIGVEKPELLPGETKKRAFSDAQVEAIFTRGAG